MHRGLKEIFLIDELVKSDKLEPVCVKNDNFLYQLNALMSLRYSENLSKNVKRGIQFKLQNGEWIGKAPFGYKNITLDEEKFDILVEIFASFLTGQKLHDISKQFNLSKNIIDRILKNPFYCRKMYIKKYDKFYPHKSANSSIKRKVD